MAEVFPPRVGAPTYGGYPIETGDVPTDYPNSKLVIIQPLDPGAVGANKVWIQFDPGDPTSASINVRNATNTGWEIVADVSPSGIPDLLEVLTEGNDAGGLNIENVDAIAVQSIKDSLGNLPDAGEVLTGVAPHSVEWLAPSAGTAIRPIRQAADADSGTGTPTVTLPLTPLQTSCFILIGCWNGSGPSSITQTNVTWTLLDSTNFGGVGETDIWKGVPTGVPGTSISFGGASSALSAAMVAEIPDCTNLALNAGAGNVLSGTSNANRRTVGRIRPTVGDVIVAATHTGGSAAVGQQILSCPSVSCIANGGQALAIGVAIGQPVTGYYPNGGSIDSTLAAITVT